MEKLGCDLGRACDAAGRTPLHMVAAAAGEVPAALRILQLLLPHGVQVRRLF